MAVQGLLRTQYDFSKLFIFNNKFRTGTYTNSSGSTVNLTKGMLIGRILSSNKVCQSVSTATDGSQIPIGVLQNDYTVDDSTDQVLSFCICGEVDRGLITFGGSDSFATLLQLGSSSDSPPSAIIYAGTVEDVLWSKGILTVATTDNTIADNA